MIISKCFWLNLTFTMWERFLIRVYAVRKPLDWKIGFTKDRCRKRIKAVLVESVLNRKKSQQKHSKFGLPIPLNEWWRSKELEILHSLPKKRTSTNDFLKQSNWKVLSTNSFVCPLELLRIWWLVFLSEIYLKYCGFSVEIKINILSSI